MPDGHQISMMQATAEAAPAPLGVGREGTETLAEALSCPPRPADAPRDTRGYGMRRVLLLADVIALVVAFMLTETIGGLRTAGPARLQNDLVLLAIAIPVWVCFARAH